MKIAIIHSFYSEDQPSGENRVVEDQVKELRRAGHDVAFMARRTDEHVTKPGYAARATWTTLSGLGASPEEELETFGADIVHVHNTFPNWGTHWLRRWGYRTVVTLHNYRPVCSNGLLFRDGHPCRDCLESAVIPAVIHRCYRGSRLASLAVGVAASPVGSLRQIPLRAARVVALNRDAADTYRDALAVPVDVVPNFVMPVPRMQYQRNGWVYVGRLGPEKGIGRLLANWPESEPLDIIGDGPLAEEVRVAASRFPAVRLLGLRPRDEVLRRLSEYEGTVLPSLCAESLPTVVLEALSAGTPAVLSNLITTARDLQAKGVAEVYDPFGDAGPLLTALSRVRGESSRMQLAAQQLHSTEYSPEVWLARMESIYEEVCRSAV